MTTLDCYWYSKYRFNSSRSPDTERNGRVALCSSQKPIYILFNKLIFALINYKIDRFIINKDRKRVFELQLQISERDSSLFKFSSIFHYLNFHERFPFYPIHINKSRSFVPSNEEVSNSSNFFFFPLFFPFFLWRGYSRGWSYWWAENTSTLLYKTEPKFMQREFTASFHCTGTV